MNQRDRNPRTYQPVPAWRVCTNPSCGVLWTSIGDTPCWACGSASRPSGSPWLNSQTGYAPADVDNARPV